MSFMLLGILNSQVSGGGAGAFDLLETTTLTSSAASVTFSGLDAYSDYKHLQIRYTVRDSGGGSLLMRANGDSSSIYSWHRLLANGSTVVSNKDDIDTEITINDMVDDGFDSGVFAAGVTDILDFSSTTKNKTFRTLYGHTRTSYLKLQLSSGLYTSTDAMTSLTLLDEGAGQFVTGSRFSLYGVK